MMNYSLASEIQIVYTLTGYTLARAIFHFLILNDLAYEGKIKNRQTDRQLNREQTPLLGE